MLPFGTWQRLSRTPVPWPLPYLALWVQPVADTKPSWRQSTLALAIEKSSSQMVPHSPLWNSSTRPSLCFRGCPASRTLRGSARACGVADGEDGGLAAAAGVVWARQQGKHQPNRRLTASRCLHGSLLIVSAVNRGSKRSLSARRHGNRGRRGTKAAPAI